jgi:membrane associated rhomboid family serine protease
VVIPLSDGLKGKRPIALYLVIAAIVVAFDLQLFGSSDLVARFGSFPEQLTTAPASWFLRGLTASFLHGGAAHIAGNLVFLYVFGKSVENAMGSFAFFCAFLIFGLAGFACHWTIFPYSQVPVIGASAAISGIMGFYLVHFPHARIRTLIFLGWPLMLQIPSWALMAYWIAIQIALMVFAASTADVAYAAHVGGFFTGVFFAMIWRAMDRPSSGVRA